MILSLKAMKMLAGVNIEAQIILKVSKFSCLGKKETSYVNKNIELSFFFF